MIGSIGNPVLVDTEDAFSIKNVALFKYFLADFSSPRFLLRFLLFAEKVFREQSSGAVQSFVSLGKIRSFPIALPPLAEQHRIVAKVDELMHLCDQLEQTTETNLDAHQTLVENLLAALTNAPEEIPSVSPFAKGSALQTAQAVTGEPPPLEKGEQGGFNAWQRIATHFDTLFTTEHSIDQLKQTILQLAVMGKLVPQDPNDEPSSVLLEKIAAEKARLIAEKKIKKQKALPPIGEDEKPFALPEGWEWARFEEVVDIQGGITKGRKLSGRKTTSVPYLRVANVQRSYLDLSEIKDIEIPIEECERYGVQQGDLLITEGGDWDKVGRTAIWCNELPYIAHQNHVFKARMFLGSQNAVWLEKYLNSPFARDYFAGSSKQTTNLASINKTQLRGCLIALPPLAEQQRIVAKVDELMALCDQLKTRLNTAQQTQWQLADAVAQVSTTP